MRKVALALALALMCASCSPREEVKYFRTTAPDLNFLTSYMGRLAVREGCLVLVQGPQALSKSNVIPVDGSVAIPLFNDELDIKVEGTRVSILNAEGKLFTSGDIVTGEGGIFPIKPLDPRSAPVSDPPDVSPCRGTLIQVNTMNRSDLDKIYP